MKAYVVGGAVRDELLGLEVRDRDYVVVGATPEEMASQGFKPVGADFPVFLHPESHEEYALARTERKTAPGYKGFTFHASPEVTLEEDLQRRDLTINAMARAPDGTLVDPHGGQRDLAARVLRHVSLAFAEDPVRILRVARFAARFGFAVAPETMALMRKMVAAGEADALVPERVWQEIARGLQEKSPSRMLAILDESGALARILPELEDALAAQPGTREQLAARIDHAAQSGAPLPALYAALLLDTSPEAAAAVSKRVNAPSDCRDLAVLAVRERGFLANPGSPGAEQWLTLLERSDAFRRPERLAMLAQVAQADRPGAPPLLPRLQRMLADARQVDAGALAREYPDDIPGAIRRARLAAIAASG
ncbi:multifunctional CCA tRNA nucleotidyl transferase/2'3'-cyclic phosphodiesterase/2'nucleotidase/phosphatase [Betaproteobacteria bacterium GR16-43]|nr:multifunctional CCA tRNA nucleotidyl transferase/2'3'-cyclic phosphodiesterase/2'nucleotidase/phosphatase [Betaproteobacteria bacterium GR16-43]